MRIAIVGGGVVGLCCAVEAAATGMDVVLLDHPADPHGSATLAAGAMLGVIGEVTADELRRVGDGAATRAKAAALWPPLLEALGSVGPAPRVGAGGTFVVATRERDRAHLDAMQAEAARLAVAADEVSWPDLPSWVHPDGRSPLATLWVDDGWIDPRPLAEALHRWLDRHRVDRRSGEVVRCTGDRDRVTGVELADGSVVSADVVLLCAGVATTSILAASGLHDVVPAVVGGKGVSLRVRATPALPSVVRTPNREFACGVHAVPAADGTTVLGATNRVSSDPSVMGAARLSEIGHVLDAIGRDLHAGFGTADLVSVQYGHRPTSVDGRPLAGASEVPGLAVATGTGRNGVLLAPLLARWAIAEAAGETVLENQFGLEGRAAHLSRSRGAVEQLLAGSGDDLVDWLLDADGRLRATERQTLTRFLGVALSALLGDCGREEVTHARTLLAAMPIAEAIPEVFLRLAGELPWMAEHAGGGPDSAPIAGASAHRSRGLG